MIINDIYFMGLSKINFFHEREIVTEFNCVKTNFQIKLC